MGLFFFFFLGGGVGLVVLPGWLQVPLHSYYQIILVVYGRISNFGGGYKPSLLFSLAKMKTPCGFKL